jgi:phosphoglycolate phosphatase-like HAD superfamily hydrolase
VILYLFDIDGTLLHSHGSGRTAFDAVFAAQHGIANASEGIRYGGKTDPGIIDEIFRARLGRSPTTDEVAGFLDAYIPCLRAMLVTKGAVVIGGVVDALAALAARTDVLLGLATGNVRAGALEKLAAAELVAWFDHGEGSPANSNTRASLDRAIGGYGCDSQVRAELVARAIERGRVRAEENGTRIDEVIVVGDTIHDISAARACNATVCAVTTGADPADKLAHADVVFASLAELPAWHSRRFG